MKRLILFLSGGIALLAALFGTAAAAGGAGPGDALILSGLWQTVGGNAAQWYQFDYAGNKTHILITVDDYGVAGVRLAIYTPSEIASWQAGAVLTPIGVGSPIPDHDLGWAGQFPTAGRYYAVVYNDSSGSISINVRVTGSGVTTTTTAQTTPTPLTNPFAVIPPLGGGIKGKLVFMESAGGKIYTVNGDGTKLVATSQGIDPEWNRAGTQIALARQGPTAGIFTMNPDGSNENLVAAINEPRAPDWRPDGTSIAFSSLDKLKGGGKVCFFGHCFTTPVQALWKLSAVSSAGGTVNEVRSTSHAYTPTWNADGATIAYEDPAIGIMQTSISGTYDPFPFIGDLRRTTATYNPLRTMSPTYSPDGTMIAYMVLQAPAWQIAVANADGSNQRLLTQMDPLDFVHPNSVAPAWSPDGKQILFLNDRGGRWQFYVINADGTGEKQVLKNVSDTISLGYEYEGERMVSWAK